MFCKNCGKEMKNGDVFCRECGTKINEVPVSDTNTSVIASEIPKKKYPVKLVICAIITAIVIIIIACSVGGTASDDDYISAAKTVISKQLKAPSTAIYSDEKIEAQDDYGRTIVSMTVESQNSFGGYVTNSCYVLIESYDTDEDTFIYNAVTGVYLSEFGDRYADTYIDKLKENTDWNEPLEE